MIPKTIHYCWFGKSEMPELAKKCIASWHKYMPEYEYKLWNEDNFDVYSVPYTKEAYDVKKYAFVSDYVRLYALNKEGGIYLDVDFEVFKSFEDLLHWDAFAGFEGSKHSPLMMGGEMTKNDAFTLELLTKQAVLDIEKESWCAHPLRTSEAESIWIAPGKDGSRFFLALFNLSDDIRRISVSADEMEREADFISRELWSGRTEERGDLIFAELPPHDAAVFRIQN